MGRRYGEGTIFKDEHSGRYVCQIELGRDARGKRQRKKLTGRTRAEVVAKRKAFQAKPAGAKATGNKTVGEFLEGWLAHEVPKLVKSSNTVDTYRWSVNKHLVPALGHHRLEQLSADDVDEMLEAKAAAGMSHASMVRLRTHLSKALRHAQRRRLVPMDVASSDLITVPDGPKTKRRSVTRPQAERIVVAAMAEHTSPRRRGMLRHRLGPMAVVALASGLRPGELLGLSWADVDMDAEVIHVRHLLSWARPKGSDATAKKVPSLRDAKTEKSRRSLQFPAFVVDVLRRQRKEQAAEKLAAGPYWDREWDDADLVFRTGLGTPIDHANVRRAVRAICRAADLDELTTYELRHSFASLLSDVDGVHIERVADVMGHEDLRMMATYRHPLREVFDVAALPMQLVAGEQ